MTITTQDVWTALLAGSAAAWLFLLATQWRFWRSTPSLAHVAPTLPAGVAWPRVSVVVPSRDEEKAVEAATRSLLALDYPELEIVAVDDRSTDGTGAILDRLREEDPRLTVVHVTQLPPGWLGKNHANHLGAQRASGEWVLFTDGDVLFEKDALRRAVALALRCRLGHVVALPHFICPGFGERAVQTSNFGLISTRYRMWQLTSPRTAGFVGVGAFNLMRRSDHARVGGHEKLAMEVADDMKLGMMLRRTGVPQGLVDSAGLVRVRWLEGVVGSYRGLLKNAFSSMNYGWVLTVLAVAALWGMASFPYVALLLAKGSLNTALAMLCIILPMVLHGYAARRTAAGSGLEGLCTLPTAWAMGLTLLLAAGLAWRRNGITWRGTHYPLDALRKGGVHEDDWPLSDVVGWDPSLLRREG